MENQNDFLGTLYVNQAGVVIMTPYLPNLFERCGYLEHGIFKTINEQHRAYMLLCYAATGSSIIEGVENPLLKILCGIHIMDVIPNTIIITATEKETVDGMLSAIIQHWSLMRNSTVEGLQESFFQRDGKLEIDQSTNTLKVEQKSIDILLDNLPWSISHIKFSWMERHLQVQWR